jgi:Ca2+-binding EF-hand superfamily protein
MFLFLALMFSTVTFGCREIPVQAADDAFKLLDKNQDGFLSFEELGILGKNAPNHAAAEQNAEFYARMFRQLDQDGDKRISLTEWRTGKFEVHMDNIR